MEILVATSNKHKVEELQRLFAKFHQGIRLMAFSPIEDFVWPEETGATFEENAFIKAQALAEFTGKAVIADDSGLIVDALNGEPGVRSSRYAGEAASDQKNRDRIIREFATRTIESSRSRFVCTLCFSDVQRTIIAEGICEGTIHTVERGSNGFGYDPLFIPIGETKTFAEMSGEEKDRYSHRSKAVENLVAMLISLQTSEGHSFETDPLPKHDALIMASVAAVRGEEQHLRDAIRLYVRNGQDADLMYEALLQSYLFAGFPVALESLTVFADELNKMGIERPLSSEKFDLQEFTSRGKELSSKIYTGVFDKMITRFEKISPELSDWLVVEGYGKTLSRPQLDVVSRELCVVAVLAVLGKEKQLISHVRGAFLVGAKEEMLRSCADDVTEWAGNEAGELLRNVIEEYATTAE